MIDNEYEFRRGYNYGFSDGNAEGKAWEQRRIIKLLEEWLNDDNGDFGDTLKLIKGEQ